MAQARSAVELYLAANTANTAYELSAGVKALTITAGKGRAMNPAAYRGAIIRFFGTGGNNYTTAYKVWRRKRINPSTIAGVDDSIGPTATVFDRILIGSGVATLASGIGTLAAAATVPTVLSATGTYFADTLTFTIDAAYQVLVDKIGGGTDLPAAYSPADDATPAFLIIPDLFDGELEIEFDCDAGGGSTATGINATVEWTR